MLSCKVDACDEDGCQPRKGALTALYTTTNAAVTFAAADFSLTATGLVALLNVGDEVGYGDGAGIAGTVAPDSGVMTKSMVVASTSGANKVIGTDRTIALASTSSNAPVQIINRMNDRDKRAALQVTFTSSVFTCGGTACANFKRNDLVRLHSVMKNGENQPVMDGIHIVTADPGNSGETLTLSAAIGDLSNAG